VKKWLKKEIYIKLVTILLHTQPSQHFCANSCLNFMDMKF